MFTIIVFQLEYQLTFVIGLNCTSPTVDKKVVIKKLCLFDVQIITKIDTWYDYDIRIN